MSDLRFPATLKPIVNKGYSYTRGSNVYRNAVTGGLPRQGRDTYFEPVPFSVTLVTSALGNQAFQSFLNNIHGGADSFIMPLDSGLGIQDHQCIITSTVNIDSDDGKNWTIAFTITAERTAIQEDTCLTANLPDLFGCYGDCLASFLKTYGVYETTFPRIWSDEGPAGYPPINMQAQDLDGRIVYSGPSVNYLSNSGLLVPSAVNEWPLMYLDGVAVGRVAPEGSGFNGLLQSKDPSQAVWTKISVGVAVSTASPDGSLSYKVTPSAASAIHEFAQAEASSLTTGDTFTTSAFFKAAGQTVMQMRWTAGGTGTSASYHNFDTATLSTSGSALSASIVPVGNGWYRASATVLLSGTGVSKDVGFGVLQTLSQARRPTWTGDGTNGLLMWGFQIEKGANASSYIPTTTSISNRALASASVFMNGATSIDITYSDASVMNVAAVSDYAQIPQANSAWGSKFITRIDFNV